MRAMQTRHSPQMPMRPRFNSRAVADLTRGMGRMGDTEILHVSKSEIPKIQKALGTNGTRNPSSGALEFWTSADDAAAAGGGVGVGGEGGGVAGDTGGTSSGVTDGGGSGNAATDAAEATGAVGIDPGPGVSGPGVGQSPAATQAAEETGMIGIDPGPGVTQGPSGNAVAPGAPAAGGGIQGLIQGLFTPASLARTALGLMMGGPISPGMANAIASIVGQGLNATIGATNEGAVAAQGVVGEGGAPGVGAPDDNNFLAMLNNPALAGMLVGLNDQGAVAPGGGGGGGGAAAGGVAPGRTDADIARMRQFLRMGLRLV